MRTLFEGAFNKLTTGNYMVRAVLEHSAVGESQSNGLAERGVQLAEDMLRTYKLALEDRMQCSLGTKHPVFHWITDHVGSVANRTVKDSEGRTAYQKIHGAPSGTKGIEFAERILYVSIDDGG